MTQPQKPQPSSVDRQREHQANERTFLAWLRTAIALIGFGFAIARFGLFLQELQFAIAATSPERPIIGSQTLGVGLVILGLVVISLAVWRYNKVFWQIEQNAYRPSRLMVWTTAAVVLVLGLLTIPFVLLRQPSRPDTQSKSQITAPLQQWVAHLLTPHS